MADLLSSIINVLPEYQRQAIKSLIERKKKTGEAPSIRLQQSQAVEIYNRIKSNLGKLILNPRYASSGEKISSTNHNKNMEEIFLDLNALYTSIDQLSKVGDQQYITLSSEYDKSKAAIQKLITDASTFALRKQYPDFNEVKFIDFNSANNATVRAPSCEIDPKTRLLKLRPISYSRAHLSNRGGKTTKVYTKTYAKGISGTLSKSFPPDYMVDQRPETFWASLVMSDLPISQIYERNTKSVNNNKVPVAGPVTEIYLRFSHVERVNTIKFLPFSDYPIKVIDVAYRGSPTSQIFDSVEDFYPVSTLDWEEINFSPVFAYEVRITIAQENYKKVIYHLPKYLTINTDLFQQIFSKRATGIIDNALVPDSDSLIDILKTVDSYSSALELLQDILYISGADAIKYPETKYYDSINSILQEVYSNIDPELRSKIEYRISEASKSFTDNQLEIVEVKKYEYILGMREVECGYVVYSPTAYYASDRLDSQATISEVSIEVEERHTSFTTQWEEDYKKTSIEWDIDIGDDRRIPIHPRNIVDEIDEIPAVKDERIYFESNEAVTRLGAYYSSVYRLKKDGNLIPVTDYNVVKITGAAPRLKVTLTSGNWLDSAGVFTVDYAVDPGSYSIQILDKFDSKPLYTPEKFQATGPDSDILLSKYPYINYEVINLTGHFTFNTGYNAWVFNPPQADLSSGQLRLTPTILDSVGNILQSGNVTGLLLTGIWGSRSGIGPSQLAGNTGLSASYFGVVDGVQFGYFVKVMDSLNFIEVDQFSTATSMLFKNPFEATLSELEKWDVYSTGVVFNGSLTGDSISGVLTADYVLGIGIKTDGQIFALSETEYNPIIVTIGGKEAKNITNYETLQHPAFSISNIKDNEYQYIQAGKRIYFNQKIANKEIAVTYRWVTDSLSLLGTLRCNKLDTTDLSPKVNDVRILINNLVI